MDAVRQEGPGGMFLSRPITRYAHFKDWVFMSPLFPSHTYVTSTKRGSVRQPSRPPRISGRSCTRAVQRTPGSTRGSTRRSAST